MGTKDYILGLASGDNNPPKGSKEWAEQNGGGNIDSPLASAAPTAAEAAAVKEPKAVTPAAPTAAAEATASTAPSASPSTAVKEENVAKEAATAAPPLASAAPATNVAYAPWASNANAATTAKDTPVAEPATMTYVDLYKKLNPYKAPTEEELEKERKKQKRDQMFAAIGDGVSALANLFFTTRGAPNMYDGKNNASGKTKIRYDKLKKEREDNQNNYYNGLFRAMTADDEKARDARNWKRTLGLDAKEDERFNYNKEHQKEREAVADKQYQDQFDYKKVRDKLGDEWKQKEFDQRVKQFGAQNALAWANHNLSLRAHNDSVSLQKQQMGFRNAGAARGKQLGFSDGNGNEVSVYENVWKGSMQQVYDAMLSDLAPQDAKGKARYERQMKKLDTQQKKEDYVKQNWHNSQKAKKIMLRLSQIDPATMNNEVNGGGLNWGGNNNNSSNETDW